MEKVKSHVKEVLPFLCVTCIIFIYIEEYNENMHYNAWISLFYALTKAIWSEMCAFTTWKGMCHFKLIDSKRIDHFVIHVFCLAMTMIMIHPNLFWLLKLSVIFAMFLTFLVIRLLPGNFELSKLLEVSTSKACRRSPKRNCPKKGLNSNVACTIQQRTVFSQENRKSQIPQANVYPIPNGASGDSLSNSFSTTHPPGNLLKNETSRISAYHPIVSNSTSTKLTSKYQGLSTVLHSKSIQAGVSTTSMVESSTSTSTSHPAWNPHLAIRTRQGTPYYSTLKDSSPLSQVSHMSESRVSVSTQASSTTPTSSEWKVLEYKTRNGKVYKAILCNEKAGISRRIDPDILYGNDVNSDYTENN